jgi:hypothetical protein
VDERALTDERTGLTFGYLDAKTLEGGWIEHRPTLREPARAGEMGESPRSRSQEAMRGSFVNRPRPGRSE